MRYDDLYVSGVGSWYPRCTEVREAIATGQYSAAVQRRTGQRAVCVAGADESNPDMAVRAGRIALRRAGKPAAEVALLLHAVATHNGLDGWNCASYLQHRIVAGHGVAFEVRQLSNGAVGGIELAAAYLHAAGGTRSALITAADQFAEPVWNRWTASPGLVFGDGASALLLSRDTGFARVRAVVTVSDPELEGVQRGTAAFRPFTDPAAPPPSLAERGREFAELMGADKVADRMAAGLTSAVAAATEEAGMALADADHVVLPNFGRELLYDDCLDPLDLDLDRTTWSWGAGVGHVGAADQFGGLDHLAARNLLTPGKSVLLIGIGGGFNWTCAVLEVLSPPAPE